MYRTLNTLQNNAKKPNSIKTKRPAEQKEKKTLLEREEMWQLPLNSFPRFLSPVKQ